MADLVYPPVVLTLKTFWKYLGLRFDSKGVENIPREGGRYPGYEPHWLS